MYLEPQLLNRMLSLGDIRFKLVHSDASMCPTDPQHSDVHIHDCFEIYLNLSGDVSFLVGDSLYEVGRGTVIFARPGEIHHCICNAPCQHDHYCLWFDSKDPSLLEAVLSFGNAYSLPDAERERVISLFERLSELEADEHILSRTTCFLDILDILATQKGETAQEQHGLPAKLPDIIRYMNEHYVTLKNLDEVFEIYQVGHATLNRWFRAYIKLSPLAFLQAKRLANAKQMLLGGASVTEAGSASGFADCAHFVATFKRYFGITPLQYKKAAYAK